MSISSSSSSLMSLSPRECYQKLKKPYSDSLHENILKWIDNTGNRMYAVSYGNPLMKYHQAIAYICYYDCSGNKGTTQMMDDDIEQRHKRKYRDM